jgi:hypothetical protein
MALTVAVVDAIRADLAAVPPKDASAREVTRLEAIARMRGEIVALREGGYTWQEIAAMVSSKGCRVTAATLSTEMLRKPGASGAKPRDRRTRGSGAKLAVGGATAPSPKETAAPEETPAEGKKEGPPRPKPAADVKQGGFVVREDSEI